MAITEPLDKLRLALGDRDPDNYVFNDEELESFLSDEANDIPAATLAAARSAEATFARAYDFETDGQRFYRSQQAKAFAAIVKRLEAQGVATSEQPSSVTTVTVTKVDGYSQTVTNEDVTAVDDDDFDTV